MTNHVAVAGSPLPVFSMHRACEFLASQMNSAFRDHVVALQKADVLPRSEGSRIWAATPQPVATLLATLVCGAPSEAAENAGWFLAATADDGSGRAALALSELLSDSGKAARVGSVRFNPSIGRIEIEWLDGLRSTVYRSQRLNREVIEREYSVPGRVFQAVAETVRWKTFGAPKILRRNLAR